MKEERHFKVRLPPEVRDFLEHRAQQQERSMTAHIVFLLRRDMENEQAAGADRVT